DPGWALDPLWQYGAPAYGGAGPTGGVTGANILGYNLSGNYENKLATKYATTTAINCAAGSGLTLKFYRWLRLRNGDSAVIQVSTNGTAWADVWSTTSSVSDSAWTAVQYALPAWTDHSPALRLRWGIGSNNSQNDLGWNIDDVEILGGGVLDTTAPLAALSVADVQTAGSPSQSFTVTYTDDVAVRIATLGSSDIVVTGPNGYSNLVSFVGVDEALDGTPRQANYSVDAPGGSWDVADNGTYQLTLRSGEVTDTSNNPIPELLLGSFNVNIAPTPNVQFSVTATPAGWGSVSPGAGSYPLGSTVLVLATPADYYRFSQWSGGASGSANPLSLTLSSNTTLVAEFKEILTTNCPTPYWWLAAYGYTNNFESAVTNVSVNGFSLWQSYVAGLTPTNPASQLRLDLTTPLAPGQWTLNWASVSGRVYTVLWSTNLYGIYTPLPNGSNLPWTVSGVTNSLETNPPEGFFRLQVTKP
ncbi:MAG TPA: hypothetical protein VNT26_05830, partial [Candidatus Sulfotelmatobacter sp.]|nr:hypothetical protein [Candidatus Sulfotelmatobacter sp.]